VQPSFASPPAPAGDQGVQIVTDATTGLYNFIGIDSAATGSALPGATALVQSQPSAAVAVSDISVYARQFGISNPSQELQFVKASGTPGESQSFRYQQTYQGIPVLGGELIANYDGRGRLAAIVGEASGKLALSTTPKNTPQRATTAALEYVAKVEGVNASDLTASPPSLWIYDPHLISPLTDAPSLVWRTEVTPASGLAPIRYLVLVDAMVDGVALAFNQIDTAWHNPNPSQPVMVQHPVVQAALPIFNAPQFSPNFANPTGATYDSQNTNLLQYPPFRVCNTPPTALTGAGSCGNFGGLTAAGAAHYFAYGVFSYYDSHHKRNSINNKGMPLISNVNYCDDYFAGTCFTPYENAFWNGREMVYGNSGWWTADDVIGHELTHGVTENESGLFYFYESGAINESFSDIFGEFFDQANGVNSFGVPDLAGDNWIMGEDLGPGFTRNMSNPPAEGDPDSTQSANYWVSASDNGGVHTNSGVGNKTAYLMAQGGSFGGYTITPLGNDKTSAIFYEVNSNLLTSGADYGVLGGAIFQACLNIMTGANPLGVTSTDCGEAREATLATGMNLDPVAAVNFRPQAEVCPNGSRITVSLFNKDMEAGLGGFTSGVLVGAGSMPPSQAWMTTKTVFGATSPYARSGTGSAFGVNAPEAFGYFAPGGYESYFQMAAPVVIPANSIFFLHFNHTFAFENGNYDGGRVEYSQDGGPWLDAGSMIEAGQGYNATISTGFQNPLGGEQAFTGQSHGYVSTRYNLAPLAGHSIRFRWVIGADTSGDYYGWFLDDIQIYNCDIQRNFTTDTTPTLTWTPISWATSYDVQISTNSTFTNPSVNEYNIPTKTESFTPPVALNPGTYFWRVRANNGATHGTWSAGDSFTVGS
jgi:Zn-dependent metalloprotease